MQALDHGSAVQCFVPAAAGLGTGHAGAEHDPGLVDHLDSGNLPKLAEVAQSLP